MERTGDRGDHGRAGAVLLPHVMGPEKEQATSVCCCTLALTHASNPFYLHLSLHLYPPAPQLLGIMFFGALLSSIAAIIQRASKEARRWAAW